MELPEEVLRLFPTEIAEKLRAWDSAYAESPEELRCRTGHPVSVLCRGRVYTVDMNSLKPSHLDSILERATKASLHTHSEELRRGFLHTSSGCRVGVCGTVYHRDGLIAGIRDVSSLSIRIPHAVKGCADGIFPQLIKNGFESTIILSPPGFGKTTLLRDLIRRLSDYGLRVSVADERGEIAAMFERKPGFDVGRNTDVLTGGNKRDCAMMLLRAMNPQVLAFDEITAREDLAAITYCAGCGAALLATAHAADWTGFRRRPVYRSLLQTGVFTKAVWVSLQNGRRVYRVEAIEP